MHTTQTRAYWYQKRRTQRECQRKKARERKKRHNRQRQEGRNLMFRLKKTIDHHCPDLYDQLRTIPDCRQQPTYSLLEILMAGLTMFLFKKASRNAMNNEREDPRFRRNYEHLFKTRLPHMDTVAEVMECLQESHIERLKADVIKSLLAKKRFRRARLLGQSYLVVIDGTHVMDVPPGHCEHCLHQPLSNGRIRYFHAVLEAKLVTDTGFCVSLGTEWIENADEYTKQDCELKAFARLADTLKRTYPRLSLCLVADGLYPNQTFFRICHKHGWSWIVTLKDGNLPRVWKRVLDRQRRHHCRTREECIRKSGQEFRRRYEWHPHLTYHGFRVHWYACEELVESTRTRFVWLSSLEMDTYSIVELSAAGRLRWKIENEGFDVQKQHGYGLGHQFSRRSMRAMKNFYQLMQIAHLMNQLFELGSLLAEVRRPKESMVHVWNCLVGELRHEELDFPVLVALLARRIRIQYE